MMTKHDRNDAIDGLRAVAVWSVFLFHFMPDLLPFGYCGVDVFFVISGYVVCKSVARSPSKPIVEVLGEFYARRVIRIYPALLICLLVTGVVSKMLFPQSFLAEKGTSTGFWAFWGLSNIELLDSGNGYFGVISDYNPYLHTWSLAVEEQFYMVFPLWFFFYRRADKYSSVFASCCLNYGLYLVLIISFGLSGWFSVNSKNLAFYSLLSRFWELGSGVVLALIHERGLLVPSKGIHSLAFSAFGIVGVLGSMIFSPRVDHPVPGALLPVFFSLLFITGVANEGCCNPVKWLLSRWIFVYLGRASYSIYLWHWPTIVFLKWTCGLESKTGSFCALPLTLLFALGSYHFVEMPFQWVGKFRGSVVFDFAYSPWRKGPVRGYLPWSYFILGFGVVAVYFSSKIYKRVSVTDAFELSITKMWKEIDYDRVLDGKLWSGRSLFIVGDSHAGHYSAIAELLRRDTGAAVHVLSEGGASFASLIKTKADADERFGNFVWRFIREKSKPGDIVFLSSLRVERLCDQWKLNQLVEVLEKRDGVEAERERGLAVLEGIEIIKKFNSMGLEVVVGAPSPILASPPFRVSDWWNRMNPIGEPGFSISRSFLEEHRNPAMRSISDVVEALPGVHVWDPLYILSPGKMFHGFDGEKPLLYDGDHLTPYANQKLYPSFRVMIDNIW